MNYVVLDPEGRAFARGRAPKGSSAKAWVGATVGMGLLSAALVYGPALLAPAAVPGAASPPKAVKVSTPLRRDVDTRLQFVGQFSAVQRVDLRAQVGGTLTEIRFRDGDVVRKGDLLFAIDPVPYEIKLSQAQAQLESAKARVELATVELERADTLRRSNYASVQTFDQRTMELRTAKAAVEVAEALVRDARFDLDRTRILAPFTGRIGTHLVSVGNLVAGSRAASSPTTLLATIVSPDSIYLNFDMSEADYMVFLRERRKRDGAFDGIVDIALSDETGFTRKGTLDFLDNALDRSSGTIHARATVPNADMLLTPGGFARVRVTVAPPTPALLVPDASVLPDQSESMVLTVGPDDVVRGKAVSLGDLRGGLRVVRSGLSPDDRVVVDGIPTVAPGSKVAPQAGLLTFDGDEERG